MISYDRLFSEMERQLELAKQTKDEAAIREALTAIQSLCKVVLGSSQREKRVASPQPTVSSISKGIPQASIGEQALREDDANGESIFDF